MKKTLFVMLAILISQLSIAQSGGKSLSTNRAYGSFGWNYDSARLQNEGGKLSTSPYTGSLGWEYQQKKGFYSLIEVSMMGGNYSGSVNNLTINDTVINANFFDTNGYQSGWEVQSRLGWQFSIGDLNDFYVIPYLGYGFQKSKLSLAQDSFNNVQGVKVNAYNSYIPLGILLNWEMVPEFKVQCNFQLQFTFDGKIEGVYSDQISNQKLEDHMNWVVELPLVYDMTEFWDMRLTPYFIYADNSALYLGGLTEKNDIWGGRLEIGYYF